MKMAMINSSKSRDKITHRIQIRDITSALINLDGNVLKIALLLEKTAKEDKVTKIEYSYTDIARLTGMTVMQVSRGVKRLAETVDIDVTVGDKSGRKTLFDVSRQPWMVAWREGDQWHINILRRQAEAFVAMHYMLLSTKPKKHWIAEMRDKTAGTDTFMDYISVRCDIESMVLSLNSSINHIVTNYPGCRYESIVACSMQYMYKCQNQYFSESRSDYTFEKYIEQYGNRLKQMLIASAQGEINKR
jgi:hypothetical protein